MVVMFAFGDILKTSIEGHIDIQVRFDERKRRTLNLITRNQANAEFRGEGMYAFVAELLRSAELQASTNSRPKGRSELALPLSQGHQVVNEMLARCSPQLQTKVQQQIALQTAVPSTTPGARIKVGSSLAKTIGTRVIQTVAPKQRRPS